MLESELIALQRKLRFKYASERFIAFFLLICLSPFYILIALLIKVDGLINPKNAGSIFYTETRISAGQTFKIIKFRTVTEQRVRQIKKSKVETSITGSSDQTWAGAFILRWYLDELPQLINILKGEMSFVGPRPHIISQHEGNLRHGLIYRNYLKAGLLGVPQACKKHPKYRAIFVQMASTHKSSSDALNTLDGIYVRKCLRSSLFQIFLFDLYIIGRGIVVVFRGE